MVKRMLCLFVAFLLFSATASLAAASPPKEQSRPVLLFTGTFVNRVGGTHPFRVFDGGNINIKNEKEGLYYRLSTRSGVAGTVEVTIERFGAADFSLPVAEERMMVALDGGRHASSIAPFQFALNGVQKGRAVLRSGPHPDFATDWVEGACCISCGDGWIICCGVGVYEPGWIACCSIDTSCAWCEVCAWWIQ
jgi:hypothetical protein